MTMQARYFPALAATLLAGGICAVSCAQKTDIDLTPPSTSPEGLAEFFTKECLEQQGAEKARALFARARDACSGDSRCLDDLEIPAQVGWVVTAPDKEKLEVIYDWRWLGPREPPPGFLGCSIAVPNRLEANLRAAITRLRVDGRGFVKTENKYAYDLLDRIESWDADTRPSPRLTLTLQHYPSPNTPDAGPIPPKDSFEYSSYQNDLKNIRTQLQAHADRPWKLKVGLPKNQP